MLKLLVRLSAAWTGIGLASGLFYREMTKHYGLAGTRQIAGTQLAVVHTHTLVLGTVMLLVLLALAAQLPSLQTDSRFRWAVWLWQVGLGLTSIGMLVKGTMQVSDTPGFDSPALAGVSGLGHTVLTAALVLLFLALDRAVRARGDHALPRTADAGTVVGDGAAS
ncbi:DUF2871 domain-containing protein [Georgenia satyanarayanai]|uniref:DUF2871 family protein n=1 Tax=Georgenia satyanarayanai TaxID=860221 RepID=UPI00203D8FF9|nr:DUF2871 family protein [Georgenia satyanarayanai]MCM3660648.1 DUF2871 domain-containing protein [Georgenia satyanarayanai]